MDPSGHVYNGQFVTESNSLNQDAQRTLDTVEIAEEFSSLPVNDALSDNEEVMDENDESG